MMNDISPVNAILAHQDDSCVTVTAAVARGQAVTYLDGGGSLRRLSARDDIPVYHKLAITPIARGAAVLKYGSAIGIAAADIAAGAHIHIHNLEPLPRGGEV